MKRIIAIAVLAMAVPSFVFSQTREKKATSSNKARATANREAERKVEQSPVELREDKKLATDFERVIKSAGEYDKGPGLLLDLCVKQRANWQSKAMNGIPKAQFLWGLCNFYNAYGGASAEQNQIEAVNWFSKAAAQGLAAAQSQMGSCYEFGRGVDKNATEAVKWFRKAANQNWALAQHHLGKCYRFCFGVPCDYEESFKWELMAAKQGLTLAQTDMADMLRDGIGRPKDEVEACRWYKRAADQNDPVGQERLRDCYARGIRVPRN